MNLKPRIWTETDSADDDNALIFMGINKTGSSSLFDWMNKHSVDYFMSRYKNNDGRKFSLIDTVKKKKLRAFTLVRNPFDRAVSSWKYCIIKKGLAECSFRDFLLIPDEQLTPQQLFHSSPQWAHVVDRDNSIDYFHHIGRFENIEATCRWIAGVQGFTYQGDLPHHKKTERTAYRDYYDDQTRRMVEDKFARDIELFNYRF